MTEDKLTIGDRYIFLGQYGTVIGFSFNKQYERELPIFQKDKRPHYFGHCLPEDLYSIPEGQMELLGIPVEPFPEPPEPEECFTINAYLRAWKEWEAKHGKDGVRFATRTPKRYQYRSREKTPQPRKARSLAAQNLLKTVYPKVSFEYKEKT